MSAQIIKHLIVFPVFVKGEKEPRELCFSTQRDITFLHKGDDLLLKVHNPLDVHTMLNIRLQYKDKELLWSSKLSQITYHFDVSYRDQKDGHHLVADEKNQFDPELVENITNSLNRFFQHQDF